MSYSDVPPYTEPYVRWLERTVRVIIPHFLLNCRNDSPISMAVDKDLVVIRLSFVKT
jgi:hypothetical protein